jgi:ubiquinone biosynthesis protein COQ4
MLTVTRNTDLYRIQPRRALAGIRRLIADKEDTEAVFEIMRALSGRAIPNGYRRLVESAEGGRIALQAQELAPLLDDHDALRSLPPGTVGRAYVDFVEGRKISAEGLAEESRKIRDTDIDAVHPYAWYARRMRDVHDLWHVLTGYNTDALGEACVVAFSYAQTRSAGFALIAFAGAREIARHLPGQPVRRAVWQAWRNGSKASWLPELDYPALLAEPLDQARRRLNIAKPSWYLAIPPVTGIMEGAVAQAA